MGGTAVPEEAGFSLVDRLSDRLRESVLVEEPSPTTYEILGREEAKNLEPGDEVRARECLDRGSDGLEPGEWYTVREAVLDGWMVDVAGGSVHGYSEFIHYRKKAEA